MSKHTPGPCLWMVCYKTSPDSYQTYWNVYPAECAEDATKQAESEDLFKHGRRHTYTVPYNRAGMSVEETYADFLREKGDVQGLLRLSADAIAKATGSAT